MFRSARWKREKNKIKTVFKLQFHLTQVQQLCVDALMVSVVPGEVGKPTVRLEKAAILDGSCRWENPVYETVNFIRDPKTGKINERVYHFLVSNGSSKAGLIGEVSIDIADYVEATKTSTVSLPLKNSNSNAVLHVTIQRLQANVDHREMEDSEDAKIKTPDWNLKTQLSNSDIDVGVKSDSAEDGQINKIPYNVELNGNRRASSGSDITMSSSESTSGLDTPQELEPKNKNIHSSTNFLSSLSHISVNSKLTANASTAVHEEHGNSQWEWHEGSDHGVSTDDSINNSQDALPRETSQQASDNEMERLKAELAILARKADVSELELQTLRKQIVKESKRGQDLSREVVSLKAERDALKVKCENFKAFHKCMDETKVQNKSQFEGRDLLAPVEAITQGLNYEKDLNSNIQLQLQKTQESNAELTLAVRDLNELLKQKNREISDLSEKLGSCENADKSRGTISTCETDDEEQKALEELVKEHTDAKETYMLEQKLIDLYSEIEIYRRDKDDLEMHVEQLALDYEILKQENHDISYKLKQNQMQEQLKMQYECSSSFANINELESQIESLENELKKHSEEYADSLTTINELESHINSLENKLKKQSDEYCDSLATINQLESQVERLENEVKNHSKEYSDSLTTINELESCINSLENKLKKQSDEDSDSLATIKELEFHIQSLEKRHEDHSKEYPYSLSTTKELESHIKRLENELKRQSKEYSDSLATINDLESYIKSLEEEMEKQMQGFEADLEAITCAKVEQEQRAIRAEEALHITRWKNASTAERIQEEFKRLSMQMTSTFDGNEKVTMKALTEASDLRMQKGQLEELLQKAKEKLQSVREDYEAKLDKLSNQIDLKTTQLEQLLLEIDAKSEQLECQKKHEDEVSGTFSQEILTLKADIERLRTENNFLNGQAEERENMRAELEQMRASFKETEMLVQRQNGERNELVSTIALMKKEAEKSLEELTSMRLLKDEEAALGLLQPEFLTLKAQCNELKHSLFEGESEKEKLGKQVSKGTSDLKSNGGITEEVRRTAAYLISTECLSKENGNAVSLNKSNNENLSQKELGASRNKDGNLDNLLADLTLLKEKNKSMESELKEMQEMYTEISVRFAEVEGERQKLIMSVRTLKNAQKTK